MNWKIIVGILIIYGSVREAFAIAEDARSGPNHFPPFWGALIMSPLILLGFYLIKKGREKKTLK